MLVITHQRVDLDACASVWLAKRYLGGDEVRFVPADWQGPVLEGELAVDLPVGIKGERSAFEALLSQIEGVGLKVEELEMEALRRIAEFVSAVDTASIPFAKSQEGQYLRDFGLQAVIHGAHSVRTPDEEIVDFIIQALDLVLANIKASIEAERAQPDEVVGRVAVLYDRPPNHTYFMFGKGFRAVVYRSGNNLGVVRARDSKVRMDHPKVKELTAGEDGWFFHPAGFLAGRGTAKAPASSPSRIDPLELARVVDEIID